jgi:hypothetical protein
MRPSFCRSVAVAQDGNLAAPRVTAQQVEAAVRRRLALQLL